MIKDILLLVIIVTLTGSVVFSQTANEDVKIQKQSEKYAFGLIPSRASNIYGIAIGPIGSEVVCGYPYYKKSHGLNIQFFGQGILWVFSKWPSYHQLYKNDSANNSIDTLKKYDMLRAHHNGFLFSTFGALETNINGVTSSLIFGSGSFINGLALNLMWNRYHKVNGLSIGLLNQSGETKGLQIGLINKSVKLKGLQVGLWNINESRKLPLINWSTNNK